MSEIGTVIICIIIVAAVILFGVGLWQIFRLLQHGKGGWALLLGIILIIAFPFCLDQLILHKWYIAIPIESSRDAEEWMDFLGSYLGIVGTIVMGALAYWQTGVNRKQDQEIEKQKESIEIQNREIRDLQAQVAAYQIKPAVSIKSGEVKVYAGDQKQNINEMNYTSIYHSMHGIVPSDKRSDFVYIKIPFREKGLVPIEQIHIKKIEWRIAARLYGINLKKEKYAELNEELQILIDDGDVIKRAGREGNCGTEFIDAMMTHQENYTIGKSNFSQSQLTIEVEFINQIGKPRDYRLNYFLQSNKEAERLYLEHPNVTIIEKEDQNETTDGQGN